jgi:hypothetical protein
MESSAQFHTVSSLLCLHHLVAETTNFAGARIVHGQNSWGSIPHKRKTVYSLPQHSTSSRVHLGSRVYLGPV